MLCKLKGSRVVWIWECFSFPYNCHPFQIMENINGSTPNIQDIKSIQKRRATWDEPIEMVQL